MLLKHLLGKPLCEGNHLMLHVNETVKAKDVEVLIADVDIEACDNGLDLTPPLHCPLPPTYSGYWIKDRANVLKLIYDIV